MISSASSLSFILLHLHYLAVALPGSLLMVQPGSHSCSRVFAFIRDSLLERLLRDKLVKEIPFHRESFYVTGTLLLIPADLLFIPVS